MGVKVDNVLKESFSESDYQQIFTKLTTDICTTMSAYAYLGEIFLENEFRQKGAMARVYGAYDGFIAMCATYGI
jgi:hypothetical protein